MTNQDLDDARAFATIEAPPEDDFPTGTKHSVPSFVGQPPPLQIPSAPEWTGELFTAIREMRTDLRTMKQSLDLLHGQFDSFSWEFRARAHNMEGLLLKHQTAIAELQGDVASLDRRLSSFESDGK